MGRLVVQTLLDPFEPVDARVDAVELRLDLHPEADVKAVRRRHGKPLIACVRRARDGNLLAAATTNPAAIGQVYNIALGERTTLNQLFELLQQAVRRADPRLPEQRARYRDFREGDMRHSLADISKAQALLAYAPTPRIDQGLELAMAWYGQNLGLAASDAPG